MREQRVALFAIENIIAGSFFRGFFVERFEFLHNPSTLAEGNARQSRGRERSTMQVVRQIAVQWFDCCLDELEQWAGFFLLELAIDGSRHRLPAARIVIAQVN